MFNDRKVGQCVCVAQTRFDFLYRCHDPRLLLFQLQIFKVVRQLVEQADHRSRRQSVPKQPPLQGFMHGQSGHGCLLPA